MVRFTAETPETKWPRTWLKPLQEPVGLCTVTSGHPLSKSGMFQSVYPLCSQLLERMTWREAVTGISSSCETWRKCTLWRLWHDDSMSLSLPERVTKVTDCHALLSVFSFLIPVVDLFIIFNEPCCVYLFIFVFIYSSMFSNYSVLNTKPGKIINEHCSYYLWFMVYLETFDIYFL